MCLMLMQVDAINGTKYFKSAKAWTVRLRGGEDGVIILGPEIFLNPTQQYAEPPS